MCGAGKAAIAALRSPAYGKLKNVPAVSSEAQALALLQSMTQYTFYLRIERGGSTPSSGGSSGPRHVSVAGEQTFVMDGYYAWFYEGSQWTTYAAGVGMVLVMLAGVMFPLWPAVMRLGVWYLSVGVLGLVGAFFVLAIVRLVFYIFSVVITPPGIWIFPKLFADVGVVSVSSPLVVYGLGGEGMLTCGQVESFIPLWEWDLPKKKKKSGKKRKGKEVVVSGEEKASGNGNGEASVDDGGRDSAERSRPGSRSARVEDVPEDDS